MKVLSIQIKQLAFQQGAHLAGITSVERLVDSPPSGNAAALMPGARSVISFALALDGNKTADITEMTEFHPEFSHRYAGVAAGLGRLG